jgi:tetratricopeptide (TPR) repeat protein
VLIRQHALIYNAQGSYDEALEWYHKSLEIFEQIVDRASLVTTLRNMGLLEKERGELQRALEYFNRSRDLYEQIGLEKHVALVEAAIAEVRRQMEK